MIREISLYTKTIGKYCLSALGKYCLSVLEFLGSATGMGALSFLSIVYNPYMLIVTVPVGIYLYVDEGL